MHSFVLPTSVAASEAVYSLCEQMGPWIGKILLGWSSGIAAALLSLLSALGPSSVCSASKFHAL